MIHEQNAVAGTTNRLLAPLASRVVAGFPQAFKSGVAFEVLGNPVRAELIRAGEQQQFDYTGQRALRLLVLGGSLGAKPLNDVLPLAVNELGSKGLTLEVLHQTGDAHVDAVVQSYGDSREGIRVAPFIDDMVEAYAWADLVVCRAGALTVAELAIMGRPAILVPLPHAIDDHQTANARSLADRGGAVLLRQADMNVDDLARQIEGYVQDPEQLKAMAAAARTAAMPGATKAVADRCEELCHAD